MSPGIRPRGSGAELRLICGTPGKRDLTALSAKARANHYALKDKARRQLSIVEVRRIRSDQPKSQAARVLSEFEPSDLWGRILFWIGRKIDALRWQWEQKRFR